MIFYYNITWLIAPVAYVSGRWRFSVYWNSANNFGSYHGSVNITTFIHKHIKFNTWFCSCISWVFTKPCWNIRPITELARETV